MRKLNSMLEEDKQTSAKKRKKSRTRSEIGRRMISIELFEQATFK